MSRALAVLLAALLCAPPARAAAYHDVLPGARAMGMGNAFGAIADDAFGLFYNPAGPANTPFAQAGGTMGRVLSPKGPLFLASGAYLRPYEPIATATVGAAYYLERQKNGGDVDQLIGHYSQEYKVRSLPLAKPLKVGVNVKVVNSVSNKECGSPSPLSPCDSNGNGKSLFGLGFDAGVIARSNIGLSFGAALMDMVTSAAYPRPSILLSTAYTWQRRYTFATDFRIKGNQADLYPGVEASFHQGLLRLRAGRGVGVDGVSTIAFGAGVNFSPVVLDIAATLPFAGLNRQAGGYQATLSYRFGAPSFAGQFVGSAAAQAERLRAEVDSLEDRQKTDEQQAKTAESDRAVAEQALRVLELRSREAQDEYRELLKKNDELRYRNQETAAEVLGRPKPPPPAPVRRAAAAPVWPKRHVVAAGDTLRTIAREYYGDPNQWERIYDANRDKVDRGLPVEGATLSIPRP